jgi:hypothetical protein
MHQAKHKPMLNTNDLEATYKTNLMLININQNKQLKPSELIPPCHMPFVLKIQLKHEKQTLGQSLGSKGEKYFKTEHENWHKSSSIK